VGSEGKLGVQAEVRGVAGTWKDLTDNVNSMAGNLTAQVRTRRSHQGRCERRPLEEDHDVEGEILDLKDTINVMVDQPACLPRK